jgi:hypothetical protein
MKQTASNQSSVVVRIPSTGRSFCCHLPSMVDERKKMIAGAVTEVDEIVSTNLLTDSQPLVEKLDQKGTTSDVESPDCLGMAIPIIL